MSTEEIIKLLNMYKRIAKELEESRDFSVSTRQCYEKVVDTIKDLQKMLENVPENLLGQSRIYEHCKILLENAPGNLLGQDYPTFSNVYKNDEEIKQSRIYEYGKTLLENAPDTLVTPGNLIGQDHPAFGNVYRDSREGPIYFKDRLARFDSTGFF